MVWHDEFNEGTSLGNDWTHEVQGAGWVNNELQNYVNGSADGKRVTELVDGKLNINCFKGSDGKIISLIVTFVSAGFPPKSKTKDIACISLGAFLFATQNLLSILLFSLIACGSSDDKEPQSEDVTIKCSTEKIEAVAQASNMW